MKLAALGTDFVSLGRKRDAAARLRVVNRLMRLHGLPQKIGQILALSELQDDSPMFVRLTETPPELSVGEVKAEISKSLGIPWDACFRSIESNGVAGSLAQVHRATLHDGRAAAVKVQLPGIAESLELDLKMLGWLTVPIGGLRRGFDVASYRHEVGTMLRREVDFRQEAANLRAFGKSTIRMPNVALPEVIEEFSNDKVLTMTWLDGGGFSIVRTWPREAREQAGNILLELFFTGIFSTRLFHADPHPGNYRFSYDSERVQIGLLDFGCTRELSGEVSAAFSALIRDTIANVSESATESVIERFVSLGFHRGLLTPLQDRLPGLCRILFEPFLRDAPFDMADWRLNERVSEALGNYRWNFRVAGPANLIYFMRAYQGLIQYLSALDVPLNWRATFEKAASPDCVQGTGNSIAVESFEPELFRVLRIRVVRGGVTKAELIFPATAVESLSDLIPPEVAPQLVARQIHVGRISHTAVANGLPAGELFRLQEGKDDFTVWLE